MKIGIAMATRGRYRRAAAVIEGALALASGKYEIEVGLGVDTDDFPAQEFFFDHYSDVVIALDVPGKSLGAVWNRAVNALPDCQIITALADDAFVCTPNWDAHLANWSETQGHSIAACVTWNDNTSPGFAPAVTRSWLDAAGFYTELFPYWFDDSWLAEVWAFTTGRTIPLAQDLWLVSKKGKTQNMRDLGFWWQFYRDMRPLRMAKAEMLRKKLGIIVASASIDELFSQFEKRDDFHQGNLGLFTALSAENGPPSASYLALKANAETFRAKLKDGIDEYRSAA